MARHSDTSPEAERVLLDVLRTMPFGRKWRQLGALYGTGRRLHAAGVLARDPTATPRDVLADWARQGGYALPPGEGGAVIDNEDSIRVVQEVIATLDRLDVRYALSGSWASSLLGKMRLTHDADLCVEPFPGKEAAFCAAFGDDYYVSLDAVRQAVRSHRSFNVISTTTGFKVDLFVTSPRPFDQSLLARRRPHRLSPASTETVQLVSAEDVILLKLEWYRLGGESAANQWNDVLGVFQVQGPALDQAYLDRWAEQLGVADLLARARAELASEGQP